MEKSKYQIAKRLPPLGFVLFIVLLCACNGGYEPEVGGDEVIIPDYLKEDPYNLTTVKVKIPKKITEYIEVHDKAEAYQVRWTNVGVTVEADTIEGGHSVSTTENKHSITTTTIFIFPTFDTSAISTITIEVYKCLPDDTTGALEPRGLVASKEIPTTNTPTP